MGQAESTSATRCQLLETGTGSVRWSNSEAGTKTASTSLVGVKNATQASQKPRTRPGTRRSRSSEYAPEPRGAERRRRPPPRGKEPPKPEQPREPRELEGGRTSYRPLADLPHHHPVEAEAEARREAGDPFPLKIARGGAPRDARDRLNEYRSDYIGPRSDHPASSPKSATLCLSPRIDGYDFSKYLMDGGASLNIMYLETLEKMNLTKDQLKHSTTEFHGVVPGKRQTLRHQTPVAFGDVNNYREEMITFEVVPFKSSYHVIFGSPPTTSSTPGIYIYNKLKIRVLTESALVEFLRANMDIFAWQPSDMSGVPRELAEHYLNINPGATYQRTMQRCLKDQIGRNVHAYVDDIAVMTRKGSDLLSDLKETFDNLRQYNDVESAEVQFRGTGFSVALLKFIFKGLV
ncbi:hypothetical protein QYE76_030756 [Lolium multiflorum]|uniref:Uncharacterized protein n=1 Tax=Lolium multiflorum TaxID=4521 RepID=A0AAD8VJM4_LOLMU|nr:hypothetical protein QYE76_030756 [Lolium multiflorum]